MGKLHNSNGQATTTAITNYCGLRKIKVVKRLHQ